MPALLIDENKKAPRKRSGFTLTELAIVLGVMGVILSAVWVAAAKVSQNNKVQKAAGEAITILTNYRQFYAMRGIDDAVAFDDVTCIGVNAGYFPTDMLNTTNGPCAETGTSSTQYAVYNPWGGYAGVQVSQTNNLVLVYFNNLSQSACDSLATTLYASNSSSVIYQWINGNSNFLPPLGATLNTPWTNIQIDGYCAAGNSNVVEVGVAAR